MFIAPKDNIPLTANWVLPVWNLHPVYRRMEAVVGSEMPFAPAREPMKVLAGLEVPAKAIERAAESIGAEIAAVTSRKSTAPNNSSCPLFPNRTSRKCMC